MECTEDAKLFNADFLFALAANTGGVNELDCLLVIVERNSIEVTSSASDVGHERLLFACKRVEKVAFADIWATDERNAKHVVWSFFVCDGNNRNDTV